MNLHAIAGAVVNLVNPSVRMKIHISTGDAIQPDGRRLPTYETVENVLGQMQSLSASDTQLVEKLNISSETRKIYLHGRYYGANRAEISGGDIIEFPDGAEWPYGTVWKVTAVLEQYRHWCCVAVTRQMPGTVPA
jgi:hypothetical protein